MQNLNKQLIRAKLLRQLLIGKVSDIIGVEKTLELLKECKIEIDKIKTDENN
jgi:hypothetical protein